jgi:hypothetical protein
MPYTGNKPSAVPLTSADIADGIITSAKIVDGTIVNSDINASAAIVSTKLSGVGITLGTSVASTSGTSIDFTGLPSSIKIITIMLRGVSTSGTSLPIIQLGDSGGVENTGYLSTGSRIATTTAASSAFTTGFGLQTSATATLVLNGIIQISTLGSNSWVAFGNITDSDATWTIFCSGGKSLSDTLDRVRITTVGGTDTFDAGSININYQ